MCEVHKPEKYPDQKQQTGFFWHVHHDKLIEWCYSRIERTKYILDNKAINEIETRLRLLSPVRGKLPQELIKVWQKYNMVTQELSRAWKEYRVGLHSKTWREYDKASNELYKAKQELWEALNNNKEVIEALHKEECPNCPWDGNTIFPKVA